MEDSQIIQLFNERSEQAIVELSKKYGRLCSKIAINIVKSESDVEECVNDAYLSIWNTIPPTIPKSLTAYVCHKHNAIIDAACKNILYPLAALIVNAFKLIHGIAYIEHTVKEICFSLHKKSVSGNTF